MPLSISAMNHLRNLKPRRLQRRKVVDNIDTASCQYVGESALLSGGGRLSRQSYDSAIDVGAHPHTPFPKVYRGYEDWASINGAVSEYGGSTLCGTASVASGRPSEDTVREFCKAKKLPSLPPNHRDTTYSSDEEDEIVDQMWQLYTSDKVTPAEVWNDLLPWLLSNFNSILGEHNPGAIDLIQTSATPKICITVEDASLVNRQQLEQRLASQSPVHFEIDIQQGFVGRTDRRHAPKKPRWPAANPNFYQWPTCGASIGVDGTDDVASLGGFIQLRFSGNEDWILMGLTSHHLLEERTASTIPGNGVKDGKLDGRFYHITQPALQHIEEEEYRVKRHIEVNEAMARRFSALRDQGAAEQLHLNRESLLLQLFQLQSLDPSIIRFGQIFLSSGYGIMVDNHQMDWALISSIPASRYTASNLLPSFPISNLSFNPTITPLTTVFSPSHFSAVSTLLPQLSTPHRTPPESIARIHGCGAISGPQSGFLSGMTSLVKLGRHDSPSLEWSFAPYHTLGIHGDSGSWIFSDFGEVVGMIVGRNEVTGLTYFTPMHVILRDIKRRTGAKEVRIAMWDKQNRDSAIDVSSRRTSSVTTTTTTTTATTATTATAEIARSDWGWETVEPMEIDLDINQSHDEKKTVSRASSMTLGEHMVPKPFPMAKPSAPPKPITVVKEQVQRREKRNSIEKPLPPPPDGGVSIMHNPAGRTVGKRT